MSGLAGVTRSNFDYTQFVLLLKSNTHVNELLHSQISIAFLCVFQLNTASAGVQEAKNMTIDVFYGELSHSSNAAN